jgi:hypothetical protein
MSSNEEKNEESNSILNKILKLTDEVMANLSIIEICTKDILNFELKIYYIRTLE